jgi:hypothetical protein
MTLSRYRLVAILLGLFLAFVPLVFLGFKVGSRSATMRSASELHAVQQAMAKDHLSGFLPGNHSRLSESLRRKRFTSVSVLPTMVSATHSIRIPGIGLATSVVLLKDGETNTWTVWRDFKVGERYWKTRVGTILEAGQVQAQAPERLRGD